MAIPLLGGQPLACAAVRADGTFVGDGIISVTKGGVGIYILELSPIFPAVNPNHTTIQVTCEGVNGGDMPTGCVEYPALAPGVTSTETFLVNTAYPAGIPGDHAFSVNVWRILA